MTLTSPKSSSTNADAMNDKRDEAAQRIGTIDGVVRTTLGYTGYTTKRLCTRAVYPEKSP